MLESYGDGKGSGRGYFDGVGCGRGQGAGIGWGWGSSDGFGDGYGSGVGKDSYTAAGAPKRSGPHPREGTARFGASAAFSRLLGGFQARGCRDIDREGGASGLARAGRNP